MSFDGSLDFIFPAGGSDLVPAAFDCLIANGWSVRSESEILPLGETDYGWRTVDNTWPETRDLLTRKAQAGEAVGITLFIDEYPPSGGQFLILEQHVLSFSPNIHRRHIGGLPRVADWTWYIERLLAGLEKFRPVERLEIRQSL